MRVRLKIEQRLEMKGLIDNLYRVTMNNNYDEYGYKKYVEFVLKDFDNNLKLIDIIEEELTRNINLKKLNDIKR